MSTLTTAAIGPRDRQIAVDTPSTSEMPFDFRLDAETLRCTGGGGTLFWDVERHINGTGAVSHVLGSTVVPVVDVEQSGAQLATPIVTPIAPGQAQTVPGLTSTDDVLVTKTLTSATPAVERLIRGELTLTPASTLAVAANASLAGVRGLITLTTGKTVTAGYLYGTQGKAVLDGATVNVGSDHVAGVYGQMSAAGATITSGHVAPLMSIGQSLPASDNIDMIYCENNATTVLNAILKAVANANFVIDATSEDSNSAYLAATAGSSASKYMRVKLSGTEYRIALLAAS